MLYTIGHSNISSEELLEVIRPVKIVLDVRSHPTSKWLQFQKPSLEKWLPEAGKEYEWEPDLGGWSERHERYIDQFAPYGVNISVYARGKFPKHHIALGGPKPSLSDGKQLTLPTMRPVWTNRGLYDYSFFMITSEFLRAADKLIARGQHSDIGFMCAECLPWKCHRSLIADYLLFRGVDCIDLQPKPKRHSEWIGNRLERYHLDVLKAWEDWANNEKASSELST